jgi:N-acetylglucosaminyldiphosphoundecaprenol N-acetyl-beta-D-mannosaminyltransferase
MSTLDVDTTPAPNRAFNLGIGVTATTLDRAVSIIEQWIERRAQNYVCITGAHGVIESRRDPQLRHIHNDAGTVTPDGMPLVFMARRIGFKPVLHVYCPDLMRRPTEISALQPAATVKARYPSLPIAGTLSPPFRPLTPKEDDAVVARINGAAPDIVLVGLSTPKQEYWMASHVGRLNAPVLVGVGVAFDFPAGTKSQAPAWMQRSGLKWAHRLAHEPRRLWRRHLRIVPPFPCWRLRNLSSIAPPAKCRPGQSNGVPAGPFSRGLSFRCCGRHPFPNGSSVRRQQFEVRFVGW